MNSVLKIALAQINPTVGAIDSNLARIRRFRDEAAEAGADIVVFPELAILGYPPEDLVLKPALQRVAEEAVQSLAKDTAGNGPAIIVGSCWRESGNLFNSAVVLDEGEVKAVVHKQDLPNYGVFDEKRVFAPGPPSGPVMVRGVRLGIMICEDMWTATSAECLQETGAELLIILNGSPFESDKLDERQTLAALRVRETELPLVYVNQIGGQDELAFDGTSFVLNATGKLCAQLGSWHESLALVRFEQSACGWEPQRAEINTKPEGLEAVYLAMMTGLRDYVGKTGSRAW